MFVSVATSVLPCFCLTVFVTDAFVLDIVFMS